MNLPPDHVPETLIAAAPDLLAALEGLIAASQHMAPAAMFGTESKVENIRLAGKYMEAVEAAERAIAKAKGLQP